MIALAVLLLVLVAAIVLFIVVTGANQTVRLDWEQLNIAWEASALVVFLLGAVCLLLVGLALGMFRRGTKRGIERRRELKRLREQDVERARAERAHAEQDRSERARAVPPPDGSDAGAGRSRSDASGATPADGSWYDDNSPERR